MIDAKIEEAQLSSAKAAYLAAILLANKKDVLKFDENIPLSDYLITHPSYNFLNKRLKFVAKGEALFYWYQIIELLYN